MRHNTTAVMCCLTALCQAVAGCWRKHASVAPSAYARCSLAPIDITCPSCPTLFQTWTATEDLYLTGSRDPGTDPDHDCPVNPHADPRPPANKQEVYGQLYSQENVAISGIHTHSGPAGYLQYLLYDIPARGFVHETFNVLVNGIVSVWLW